MKPQHERPIFWMAVVAIVFAAIGFACADEVEDTIASLAPVNSDLRLDWGDRNLPQFMQFNQAFRPVNSQFNFSVRFFGNPNREFPWIHNGGMDRVPALSSRKFMFLPEGKYIEVTRGIKAHGRSAPVNISYVQWAWTFPKDTLVGEVLYTGSRPFLIRTRTKLGDKHDAGWDGDEIELGEQPLGIRQVDNCVDCHRDTGQHVSLLQGHFPGRDWYGYVRGDDGIFSFRPLEPDGTIVRNFRSFVRAR